MKEREIDRLRAIAIRAGWRIRQGNGSHEMWIPPDHRYSAVTVSRNRSSDTRVLKNVRALLRKKGLKV